MAITLQDENTTCLAATTSDNRPTVLVFDSGVGGLSVYRELQKLLPDLHYIYAFDNVAFPYGEKDEAFIVERVVDIVTAVQRQHPLALAVIACNTASTVSLPALRAKFAFPVVGVVPAIKPAARLTANGIVGLLATRATVKRPYTKELIERFAQECQIELLGSAELVELAEAKLRGEEIPLEALRKIMRPWLRMQEPPDTVVLGCTHFPLIQEELLQVLPEGTRMIDSGAAIARRTAWLLEHEAPKISSSEPNIAFCMGFTPETERLCPVLQRYGFQKLEKLDV
ncbi:glutamate racemase [Salmonella enterica subsp. enterica serovar Choleraesuis]|nr:glutamate racemase [Salmonella enterica subsp. enterica serovar Choleraesuis]